MLLRYDVILKVRNPVVTENVIRETHNSLFQASRQWRAVRIKRAGKINLFALPHDLNAWNRLSTRSERSLLPCKETGNLPLFETLEQCWPVLDVDKQHLKSQSIS